jgi:hypothetical protein
METHLIILYVHLIKNTHLTQLFQISQNIKGILDGLLNKQSNKSKARLIKGRENVTEKHATTDDCAIKEIRLADGGRVVKCSKKDGGNTLPRLSGSFVQFNQVVRRGCD